MRHDLMSLSPDDLAVLTNRGTVKRAQREIETGEVTMKLEESAEGEVRAGWSDGVQCLLPAGKVVAEARCSCVATTLCRHVVRTVLAYQRQHQASPDTAQAAPADAGAPTPVPAAAPAAWDPGAMTDELLAKALPASVLSKARAIFSSGILAQVVRSSKPTAQFLALSHTVRFLVRGDPRYTHCDCPDEAPCVHTALAVWAFRLLAPERSAGLVSNTGAAEAAPSDLLDTVEKELGELADWGICGLPKAWRDRMVRLESRHRDAGLVWPAEIIAELVECFDQYAAHDARFSPQHVTRLTGELLIRCDAIRANNGSVPQLLVRGAASDRPAEIGSTRYIGLGCWARSSRRGVVVRAFLQDDGSGTVVALEREFADPAVETKESPKQFSQLAQSAFAGGYSFSALGAGHLLVHGAKRTPNCRLTLGRGRLSVTPQAYCWEKLRAPMLVEDFAELRARLATLPPVSLRPRRLTEDFHACPLAGIESVHFDPVSHGVEAVLTDLRGDRALLFHPFVSRGKEGVEAMLARLCAPGTRVVFVAGQARLDSAGLLFSPTALISEGPAGKSMLQPWIERAPVESGSQTPRESAVEALTGDDPIDRIAGPLSEIFATGLRRIMPPSLPQWRELTERTEAAGFHRLAGVLHPLAQALHGKFDSTRWDAAPATRILLRLALLLALAADLR